MAHQVRPKRFLRLPMMFAVVALSSLAGLPAGAGEYVNGYTYVAPSYYLTPPVIVAPPFFYGPTVLTPVPVFTPVYSTVAPVPTMTPVVMPFDPVWPYASMAPAYGYAAPVPAGMLVRERTVLRPYSGETTLKTYSPGGQRLSKTEIEWNRRGVEFEFRGR